ncbi:MAG: hypothetical protein EXR98_09880 [Gemmataceae bacterium]|nr:hypothetical protein [Gemmataceae bacterium]
MLHGVGLFLLLLAVVFVLQMRSALGAGRGIALGLLAILAPAGAWCALELTHRNEPPPPEDQTASEPISAQSCFKCHESHYKSWQRTYHRTMTTEAAPENIKADFGNVLHHYQGVTSHMTQEGNRFFLETIDPGWEEHIMRQGLPLDKAGPAPRRKLSVDRIVGSHWFQQLLHRDEKGRYLRLPMVYHIVENRWIHVNGAFLGPSRHYFGQTAIWNETCVFCHNTRPIKNPLITPGQPPGYATEVGELGISCEACHGAGERHVRAHQNPARRLAQHYSGEADLTIVNPAKLPVVRADDICARCHGGTMPRHKEWNKKTYADPYLAGRDLRRFWYLPYSEAEQKLHQDGADVVASPPPPGPLDGRFWGDGTPLTTALEYQGMAMSACYENGHGKMSCLTCHSMHQSDPNHQVKAGMLTNAACYSCHPGYRDKLVQHTHHAADSAGSLCYNCHMPHQVYSLLEVHRSHRISVPRVRDSVSSGKPHACNLCHLDKSLGWTQEHLGKRYGTKPEVLSDDDRKIASSLLHLARNDARSRSIVAGAFGWPPAQEASGRDWPVLLLTRSLEHERYEAVRYLLYRSIRSLHGTAAGDYNYQGTPTERANQIRRLRLRLEGPLQPDQERYPYLPLTATKGPGPPALGFDEMFQRLLKTRNDPDVHINE